MFSSRAAQIAAAAALAIAITLIWRLGSDLHLSPDDYHYLQTFLPLEGITDALRVFSSPDANASYFRPLTNFTLAVDFLRSSDPWRGATYYQSALILHLIVTVLCYLLGRRVFGLGYRGAFLLSTIFGLIASHDFNLLQVTARADLLATVFLLGVILSYGEARGRASVRMLFLSVILFALGMLAKESTLLVLPILLVGFELRPGSLVIADGSDRLRQASSAALRLLPFVVVTALVWYYRGHFVTADSELLTSEAMRDPLALLRNGGYGVAYTFLPLDFGTASVLLGEYRSAAVIAGGIIALMLAIPIWITSDRDLLSRLYTPAVFTLATSVIFLQQFERWRIYAPSIGLIALAIVIFHHIWRRGSNYPRSVLLSIVLFLAVYHFVRARDAVADASAAGALLEELKKQIAHELRDEGSPTFLGEPLSVLFVTKPAKLGSASVMKVSTPAFVRQALFEERGVLGPMPSVESALNVNGLDREQGYRELMVTRTDATTYRISTGDPSKLSLNPATPSPGGRSARDWVLQGGERFSSGRMSVHVVQALGASSIGEAEVTLTDTGAIVLYFDGKRIRSH